MNGYKEIILLKYGEMALKGLNKKSFEDILLKNVKHSLGTRCKFETSRAQSVLYLNIQSSEISTEEIIERLKKVFGISTITRAFLVEKDFEKIKEATLDIYSEQFNTAKSFKIEAKRSDKKFSMNSPQICTELGGAVFEAFEDLDVDLFDPDITVTVEIREKFAYISSEKIAGAGGIPVGSSKKAALLISGGLDSPVAGYLAAKRGLHLITVHFLSPPYTSEKAKEKVTTLIEKLTPYLGTVKAYFVNFTALQEKIRDEIEESYGTIILRRMMLRATEKICEREGIDAMITGENLGQVASQTLSAINATDRSVKTLILRPLITFDKTEIVELAYKIGTYETSILPYDDCCTIFTPKHPKTNPKPEAVEESESVIDFSPYIDEAVAFAETKYIKNKN